MLNEWLTDLRHATRSLRRTPGFTITAVGTLALAIGGVAAMFSVVDAVVLHPLPYAHPDRLVYIAATAPGSDMPEEFPVGPEFYVQYREQSRLLEDVSTFNSFTATLRTADRVERIRMSAPTNSLFSTLGAHPILGRLPVPEDESNVVVISSALWHSWFGGDSGILGRVYEIAGQSRTVIGVMGPEFRFPTDGTLLWIANDIRPADIRQPGRFGNPLVARMAPGATTEAVAKELTALARRLPERFGGSPAYARVIGQHHAVVRPILDQLLGSASRSLWVLLGAVGVVLIIACANVANLFMVRAGSRHRDLAVRRAIGATRPQLVRLQMAEALIVAGLAGGLAIVMATLALPVFLHSAPPGIPRLGDVGVNATTLLVTLSTVLLTALACGAIPALRASAPDLGRLREGGRGATGRRHWGRDALVTGQTALALVLLIASGLLVRSFRALRDVDPGYDTQDVFTFQFAPEQERLSDGPSWARFHVDFMNRLRALPGVVSVGLVENVPLNEGTSPGRFHIEENPDAESGTLLHYTWTAGDYFQTMGIQVLEGRPFTIDETTRAPGSVVISRSAANLLWPGQDPIGRRLQQQGGTAWHTVVGVVNDVMQYGFRDTPEALVYFPLVGPTPRDWAISSPAYVLKTARAEFIAPEVRALVREVAPEAPMYRVFTMAGLAEDSMIQLSFTMLTLGVVSTLALILGAVGLYGVLSYVVAERTREIGVRMALGATAAQVRRMVVAQGARVVGLGVTIGLLAALASTRALGSLLYGVTAIDVRTFLGMSAIMVVIGLLASYLPARQASGVDPMEALRSD
jgi:putative ABC transport system permease protein